MADAGRPFNGNSDARFKSFILGTGSAIGVAAVIGIVGWIFGAVVSVEQDISTIRTHQIDVMRRQDSDAVTAAAWRVEMVTQDKELDRRIHELEIQIYRLKVMVPIPDH